MFFCRYFQCFHSPFVEQQQIVEKHSGNRATATVFGNENMKQRCIISADFVFTVIVVRLTMYKDAKRAAVDEL